MQLATDHVVEPAQAQACEEAGDEGDEHATVNAAVLSNEVKAKAKTKAKPAQAPKAPGRTKYQRVNTSQDDMHVEAADDDDDFEDAA